MSKNQTDKATARPWREFRDADGHDIIAPDGRHIAGMEPHTNQDANAALIVRAVNEHGALLACEATLGRIADRIKYYAGSEEQFTLDAIAQEANQTLFTLQKLRK